MSMKIVCAPDSFKGSATAAESAAAMARGAADVFPDAEIVQLPFADGGEGTLDALLAVWNRQPQTVTTVDALGRAVTARYGMSPDGMTAIIEAAEANGLPQVSDVEPDPQRADTYGVGKIAEHVLDAGVAEILLCIGGSATTDGGTGILRALGARFLDATHDDVAPGGAGLAAVQRIDTSQLHPQAAQVRWRIAVDVDNPLTGERGAAAVFGPQKGADEEDVKALDAGLSRVAEVLAAHTGADPERYRMAKGYGAAGGIPVSLAALLHAEVVPGSTMVAEAVNLDAELATADLIFTGEGKLDSQSLGGKVVDAIQRYAPDTADVVAIVGALDLTPAQCRQAGLRAAFSIAHGPASLEQLQHESPELIHATTAHAAALWGQPAAG